MLGLRKRGRSASAILPRARRAFSLETLADRSRLPLRCCGEWQPVHRALTIGCTFCEKVAPTGVEPPGLGPGGFPSMPEPVLQPTAKAIGRTPKTNVYIHRRLIIARSFFLSRSAFIRSDAGAAPVANELAKHAAVRLLSRAGSTHPEAPCSAQAFHWAGVTNCCTTLCSDCAR